MRFPNPCGYYRVFGARDGSGFPTAIQRDSVAELGIFPQPARDLSMVLSTYRQNVENMEVAMCVRPPFVPFWNYRVEPGPRAKFCAFTMVVGLSKI